MTTTMNGTSNGKVRKTLATQLDRFDQMLDGLGNAIPEVVALTIREVAAQTVREAVQAAVSELLTNPEILGKLAAATVPIPVAEPQKAPVQPKPERPTMSDRLRGLWDRVRKTLANLRQEAVTGWQKVRTAIGNCWQGLLAKLAGLKERCQIVRRLKWQLLTALGIGVTVAAVGWFAGPIVSAVLSAIGGFGSTLAVQGGLWLRKALRWGEQSSV